MKSFRLQFINRDRSYTISTATDDVKGFMVVRAPKGTTEAMYFSHGNIDHIHSMIGFPTAHWSDLYEAETFNDEFGLYISAPAGSSQEYPSYYGGVYLTTKGLRNFWHETDKDNLSYEIKCRQGSESSDFDPEYATDTVMSIEKLGTRVGDNSIIKIEKISPKMFARLNYFNLEVEDEVYSFHVNGKDILAVVEDEDAGKVGTATLEDGTYTIKIGGALVEDFFDFDLTKIFNIRGGEGWISGDASIENVVFDSTDSGDSSEKAGAALYEKLLLEGFPTEFTLSNGATKHVFPAFKGLKDRLYWRLNIKQDTFLAISQKSPTETPTHITIENIGYDKYVYEHNVKYISEIDFTAARKSDTLKSRLVDAVMSTNDDGLVDVINYQYDAGREVQITNKHSIFKYDLDSEEFYDVTSEYITQTFYLSGKLTYEYEFDDHIVLEDFEDSNAKNIFMDSIFTGTIWEISKIGKVEKFKHEATLKAEKDLRGNVNFNTVTISCKEEVTPGEFTDGGTFTGSLDEQGKDVNGSNIYFPNVLPTDAVTFIEVTPVNSLEKLGLLNEKGFWTGTKIVDPIGPAKDIYSTTIAGDRYCTYVNQLNQKDGLLGSAWRNEYFGIINEGLIEAKKDDYDDANVFMEVTGQEVFKEKLLAMRNVDHQTSTFISPKIITQAEYNNPNSIVVSARGNGTAQYVGEFKCYDAYTGRYYYRQPIGAVGAMLAKIMDVAMGGQSPAGTNTSNGCGGQLAISVIEPKYRWTDEKLKILANKKRINPICFDNAYGLIIMDDKSTQHPDETTDWSYLGHQMSFDLAKRELRDKVMAPQLFKRISPHYMEVREKQGNDIMKARCQGNDAPWSYGAVKIFEENTPTTKAKRQFVIKAECRVTPTSDTVLLIWENLPQEE